MRQKERITKPFLRLSPGMVNTHWWGIILHTNGIFNPGRKNMHLQSMASHRTQVWEAEDMSFGERVRTLRTKHGLSAKELSALSGVPEKTIYRIETGEVSDPKLSTIEPLVKALNCTADEVLFDTEAFDGSQRLHRLLLETRETSKANQALVIQVISSLNMADKLQKEIRRNDVDRAIEQGLSLDDLAGLVGMDQEDYEYFKKNPTPQP